MSTEETTVGSVKVDMTTGPLLKKIVAFAMPLIAGGMLQQSFNTIDVVVVGRWCGHQALAAVGSNGMIITMIINLFIGLSIGANVVISHYIGRRDEEGIRRSVATVGLLAVITGMFLTVVGVLAARPLLEIASTPDDVVGLATIYLRIFFFGMPFIMAFNFGAAILRSLGDTKTPFYALIAGGLVNAGLNLLLVLVFGLGVAGVAIATVVSNVVSSTIIVALLLRQSGPFRLVAAQMRLYSSQLGKILRIGLPAGLQGVVFALSNFFILGNINLFGAEASAGSAAALNFEYYCYFVINSCVQAAVSFMSVNYAAGKYDRCRRVFWICMAVSVVGCGALNVLLVALKEPVVAMFTQSAEVARYGYIRMEVVLLLQFMASSYEIAGGSLRGLGYSLTPAVLTIFGTCLLRILWVHTVSADATDFSLLMSVYPVTWTVTGLAVLTAWFVVARRVLRPAS
ncbi:MAG: MATE family efflux transporter [Pseudoflavonifractor sp.]|nr:MATE family efflux transporter [Alloprevotella sp.]MCM1116532.1 MATE family efflux transporter [Pseudoflavonifractor sp.]